MPTVSTWLEVLNVVVGALVPLVVLYIGWKLDQRLRQLEHSQWANQRVVEKKLQLFDELMPVLNDLYCFYTFVGNWKEVTPANVISHKRLLDKKVHVYAAILGTDVVRAYELFMDCAFSTYSGLGVDAKICAVIAGFDGDRRTHGRYQWNSSWDNLFRDPPAFDKAAFEHRYQGFVVAFQKSIGIS